LFALLTEIPPAATAAAKMLCDFPRWKLARGLLYEGIAKREKMKKRTKAISGVLSAWTLIGWVCLLSACDGAGDEQDTTASMADKVDAFGKAPPGEKCIYDWECSADDGLVCRPTGDYLHPKRCLSLAQVNEQCDREQDTDCAEGLTCVEHWTEEPPRWNWYQCEVIEEPATN
jgi:hypothetical protein